MREKKYGLPEQSKRKVNYRHLGMLIAAAAAVIALIIAVIFIVIHIVSGDPFPEDVSLTKEAGSVQTEIDDEAALKLRYPSFADEQLDQAVQEKVKQLREAADGEDTVIDYRSKTVFDTYTSVLFKVTKTAEDGSSQVSYASVLYDGRQQKTLGVEDVLRNQFEQDLLDGRTQDEICAMELNENDVTLYFKDGKSQSIVFSEHKEYIALNDPNIPSLYQHEPLEIAESPTIDPDKPMVAITFDDGPNPATTPELLDLLKEYNVRCTFFMVGKNAEANPDIVKRICAEGHELGNHSWDHPDLSVLSRQEIIEQLQSTDDAVFKACGHDPVYIRPPFGAMSDTYHDSVDRDSILWTIDTRDWESHDASKIKKVIDTYVSDGSIILLHDIHEDSVKAMKSVIPDLLEKGYQLVTVGDLYKYGRLS
ncbi:MAG: polysaccharide deacetylase family protein [Merdibacter sp.]